MHLSVRREILGRISDNIRLARRSQRMTQELLAHRSGLHRTEIGKLENSERLPRLDTAVKLATALEVPLDQLVDGVTWEMPQRSWGRGGFKVDPALPLLRPHDPR
ncbi:MAG: helix-turn-helix domain-containing protein [Solirubrobacterales bacterium]